MRCASLLFTAAACIPGAAASAPSAPPSVLYDGADGATCQYFNRGASIAWKHKAGDWRDAAGTTQGIAAYSHLLLTQADRETVAQWDVTAAARAAASAGAARVGLVLAALPGGGNSLASFHSREHPDPLRRPLLRVELSDGRTEQLTAVADTHTDCSTTASLGGKIDMQGGAGRNIFLEFDISGMRGKAAIEKAVLRLTRGSTYGNVTLGTFSLDAPDTTPAPVPPPGLAAAYPGDRGIERDPAVYMATGFEPSRWEASWTENNVYSPPPTFEVVERDEAGRFAALSGRALRVIILKGHTQGLDLRYEFRKKHGSEPEEAYFRYYLRLGDDWRPTVDAGKMPGFAGTYRVAGWGDRPAHPLKGWALRGSFEKLPQPGNPLAEYVTMATFAAHPDANRGLGEVWAWTGGLNGLMARNRWYCVEQYLKLNTPGARDGVLRVWIDGRVALEKSGFRVRDVDALKIEYVWMDVYHGGRTPAPRDMRLYIDNVVIARRYIGPMTPP